MQLGLASGSAEIVMCINVVAYRGKAASRGGQSTTGPAGGMAASGDDRSPKGPQGAKMRHWEDTHQRPTAGKNACNGGAKHVKKCITGRTPIDGPREAIMPVIAEQNIMKNASLVGHPSTADRGQKCL